jgi:hypothetical protein
MTCHDCGGQMRRQTDPPDGRRPHYGRGLCRACYLRRSRAGTLADVERRRRSGADFRDDYRLLTAEGFTPAQVADRLGVTRAAVYKARTRNPTERLDSGLAPALRWSHDNHDPLNPHPPPADR